jgi:hypothetical protein
MMHTLPVIGATFMEGVTETGERTLLLASENRDRLAGFPESVSKEVLERFQVETFRTDYLLRCGEVPFNEVQRSSDPPDFKVATAGGSERLDCAALADEHRRVSYRLMDHLRRRLIAGAGDRDFSGIAGCLLSMWFGTTLSELPPKRWDDAVVQPLLDAMASCQVDRERLARLTEEIARRGFPEVMPPVIATGQTADGRAGFVANPLLGPLEGIRFSTGLGFEVELHRPSEVTATRARESFDRVVNSHDRPEIDHLLVTAGGPDRNGYLYPGEEALGAFLVKDESLVARAQHLRKVTVHLWFMREIVEVPLASLDQT